RHQPAPRHAGHARRAAGVVFLDPEPGARRQPARADARARHRDPATRARRTRAPVAGQAHRRVPQPAAAMGEHLMPNEHKPPLARIPPEVAAVSDYEPLARERMTQAAWSWLQGGAADEITVRENQAAFQRLRL